MRKILSSLLVLAMVLGMVGTAFAATYPDATGNKYEASIQKVSQLGVFVGDDKGNFNPNATITRAEFMAVVVRSLGLESAAKALAGSPTKFTDVPASHWAAGYVNVAVAQGITTGVTATTFAPSSPVTHAEVVTMLVRAMGRNADAKGEWPVGHIMVASQLSLMSGITFASNVPALRAEVAKYVDNSLIKAFKAPNAEGVLVETANNFLSSITSYNAYLNGKVTGVDVDDNTITIDGTNAATYDLATGALIYGSTLANLTGNNVQLTRDSDGNIAFAKLSTTSQIIGKVAAVDTAKKTITVGTTVYTVLDSASVTVNGLTQAGDAVAKILAVKDADVTLVLDDNGKVSYISATKLGTETTIAGKVSRVVNGTVYNYVVLATGATEYKVNSATTIVRNGAAATYADLKYGDSVKVAYDNSNVMTYVDAYGNTVTGVLNEKTTVNGVQRIKVGGTYYDVQIDSTDDLPLDAAVTAYGAATVGNSVTVTLDRAGKFTDIVNATIASQVRTLTGTSVVYNSTGSTYTLTVSDGSTYTLDTTTMGDVDAANANIKVNLVNSTFADLSAGQKVMLGFSGGKIVSIDAFVDGKGGEVTTTAIGGDLDIHFTDADSVALNPAVSADTIYALNGSANKSVADVTDGDTIAWTWDLTNWNQGGRTGAVLGTVTLVRTTVSGAIVAKGYDGTNNTITVRVGTDDLVNVLNIKSTSKIEVDGVSGKGYADLVIGQKVKLAKSGSDVTFAVVTTDTTAPKITSAAVNGGDALAVDAYLSEDAVVGFKVYKADGTFIKTVSAVKVAAAPSALGAKTIVADWDGTLADGTAAAVGNYYLVITATDAAGNVSTPVSFTVTK